MRKGASTKTAWGHSPQPGTKQCAVRLPEAMWIELKARAIKENKSIQAKILDYVDVGIQVDRDWDEEEPERYYSAKKEEKVCTVDITNAPGLKKSLSEVSEWTKEADGTMTRRKST